MNLTTQHSLADSARELRNGSLSATQSVQAALERMGETEGRIKAWVLVDAGGALAEAERLDGLPADQRGPLHGVPVGVKDIIDVLGLPTRCGSELSDGAPAVADASIVARLRALGAIVLGKTVTTEFAYFSPGPTRNPHDPRRTPGGSSSGSAAAVAAGVVPLALGTQTAASLTRPAAYCGVTGHITAQGSFDDTGITGLSPSLDTLGFLTSSVRDMDYLRRALGSAGESAGPGTQFIIWKPSTRFDVSPQMLRALDTASGRLDGVTAVVPAAGLHTGESIEAATERLIDAHTLIMAYEAVRLRAREASCPQELSPQLARLFADGRTVPEDKYVWAVKAVDGYKSAFRQLLQGGTVLLGPAAQSVAPVGLEATGSPVLSRPWQALGFPVLAVPGFRDDETGLPLGLQLVGAPGEEDALFAAGHLLESVL
jgi:Asp-tRNA(Asn)/Glu-tRNA(Gln) amidotransferase A subunit family amidase